MKKIYLTLVLCFFMACCLPAQENAIEVGHAAPPITITNWLHNVPDDVNIEGKFIILEFWATWCKPCIKSIPHINELQASAKDRDDVIFISITDEDPERAQTAIDRYDFQTVVATDVSRNTKRFFGVKAIPRTILIDNQGIIQWIGHPTLLKKRQLKLFLNGKLVPAEEHANRVEYGERAEKFSKSLREKQDHFEISEVQAYTNVKGLFTNNGTYYIGITPEALIANLMDVNLLEVEVPDSFKEKHYEVVYTNKNENLSEEARDRKLLNKVLQEFGWKLTEEKKEMMVYEIKTWNEDRLKVSKLKRSSSGGSTDEEVIIRNKNMETISNLMSNKLNILIVDKTNLQEKYDMTLSFKSLEAFEKDLKSNGLLLVPKTKKHKVFIAQDSSLVKL